MCQQTMPTEPDAETSDDPISNYECGKILPAKCEKHADGDNMKRRDHNGISPIDSSANPLEIKNILH